MNDALQLFRSGLAPATPDPLADATALPKASALDTFKAGLAPRPRETMGAFRGDINKVSIGEPNANPYPATIGPARRDVGLESAIPPGFNVGEFAGKLKGLEQTAALGDLASIPQTVERVGAGFYHGAARTARALATAAEAISSATGLPKGGAFDKLAQDWDYATEYLRGMAQGQDPEKEMPKIASDVLEAVGGMGWDLPQIMAMGPYGLAVHGGLYGLAEGGAEGAAAGVVMGALSHGILKGIAALPSGATRVAASVGVGASTTAMAGGSFQESVKEGLTWGVLGLAGGDQKVTREEFIARYPEITKVIDDAKAKVILKRLDPTISDEAIAEAGGPKKLLDYAGKLVSQHYEKVDAAIGPEAEKPGATAPPGVEPPAKTPDQLQESVLPRSEGVKATSEVLTEDRFPGAPKSKAPHTEAPGLQDVDVIMRDGRTVGLVPKGQGESVAAQLREKYPDDSIAVGAQGGASTEIHTPEQITAEVERQRTPQSIFPDANKKTDAKGDPADPYSDSELFGNSELGNEVAAILKKNGGLGVVAPGTVELGKTLDRLKTAMLDKFYPVHQLVKGLQDAGIEIDPAKNPETLIRLLGGAGGKAQAWVERERFRMDAKGNREVTGKSLEAIIKPHAKEFGAFNDYLAYRRAIEVDKNSGGKIETGIDLDRARQFVAENEAKFESASKEFTAYFHGLLDDLADSGLVSKETVAQWKKESPNYAPLRRDMTDLAQELDKHNGGATSQMLDRVLSPVRKQRGSERDVLPPCDSAVLMTYEIVSAAERNRAAQAIIDLRNLSPEMARIITKAKPPIEMKVDLNTGEKVPTLGTKTDPDVVTVSFGGKREYWRVPKEIADSMKLIHEAGLSKWVKLFSVPAKLLRTGATSAPEFAFRNPLRDWQNAFLNSKVGFNPVIDFTKGLFAMLGKTDEYWRWKESGGEWSMLVSLDRSIGEEATKRMGLEAGTAKDRLKTEAKNAVRHPIQTALRPFETLSELGEKPTRVGVFMRGRKRGLSDMEAALESRTASTDFNIRGGSEAAKIVGSTYTFVNARAQTTAQLARTWWNHPVETSIKGLVAGGIPSLALYAINRDDPEYWKRSEFERDMFWFLPLKIAGRQVKIPKSEIGVLFGTSIEKVLQYFDEKAAYRPKVTAFLKDVLQSLSPVGNKGELFPTAVRPAIEAWANRSFYYDTPLVSDQKEKLAPFLQYKATTSETMKAIGKATNISPAKLENTVRGYTGGLGRHAIRAMDFLGDKLGIFKTGARPADPINVPVLSGFVSQRAEGFESEPARKFYQIADKLDECKATLKALQQKNDAKGVIEWAQSHETEMKLLTYGKMQRPDGTTTDVWTKARTQLSTLRKAMNMVVERKDLSAGEKAKALEDLNKQVSKATDPLWELAILVEQTPKKK